MNALFPQKCPVRRPKLAGFRRSGAGRNVSFDFKETPFWQIIFQETHAF
jgi:hypothetical protein